MDGGGANRSSVAPVLSMEQLADRHCFKIKGNATVREIMFAHNSVHKTTRCKHNKHLPYKFNREKTKRLRVRNSSSCSDWYEVSFLTAFKLLNKRFLPPSSLE